VILDPYKDISEEIVLVLESLIAPEDSYHQGHKRRMARTLQVIFNEKPTGSFLEIGTSHLIPLALDMLLPDLEVFVTDFDLDKETMGDITISLNGHSKVVHCARVNIEDEPLPFFDETFDYVLCSEVLEHMEVDPMYMLAELNRVTKQKGQLILTTPNAVSTWSITKMLRGIEPYFYMQYRHDRSPYRHNYEYSIHTLVKVIKAAGFDGKIWTEDCFEEPNYGDIHKLKDAGYQLSHLGDNIFTVATKQSGVVDRYPRVIYAD
jgi:ubiquinone/menaquinone biosynthesis C-methylase UbiE